MIQQTFERFEDIIDIKQVWVVTSKDYKDLVLDQLQGINPQHVLLEPCMRNTAPCIAYVSWHIKALNPKANIVVSPSDHIVTNPVEFRRIITSSLRFVAETDAIVTLGMKPNRPETGYGYIQADLSVPSARNKEMYRVDSFKEKPDLETAQKYITQGNFFWNAGIFIWNVSTIVNAFRVYQPSISQIFESLLPLYGTEQEQAAVDEAFPKCENISVDYAILEKAEEIFVCPAQFGWSDLGTWGSLLLNSQADAHGNVTVGSSVQLFESSGCIVHVPQEKKVVIQGLEGYIVAERDNNLLVCKLSEEQRIKDFCNE